MDEWIKKLCVCIYLYIYISISIYLSIYLSIYIYEYYSDTKRKETLLFTATWMDLEGIMLSEIDQRRTNTV